MSENIQPSDDATSAEIKTEDVIRVGFSEEQIEALSELAVTPEVTGLVYGALLRLAYHDQAVTIAETDAEISRHQQAVDHAEEILDKDPWMQERVAEIDAAIVQQLGWLDREPRPVS